MPVWNRIQDQRAGLLYNLSESLALIEWRHPGLLQPVTDGVMIISSDYSGQHQGATHEAHSFLVTTDQALDEWRLVRRQFRSRWLADGRRMSFKQLREPVRWRALIPFLNTTGAIRGNLITFLVDRRIPSFIEGGPEALAEVFPDCFPPETPRGTMEKMFRLSNFLAILTAGLRREDQRSFWISDHDESLATFQRREQFARLSTYLTFGLTHWHKAADLEFATTESPHAPDWAEDLASIPDLIAGACCNISGLLPSYCGTELWTRLVPSSAERDPRARAIANWMATTRGPLRQVLLRLELGEDGDTHASAQFFAGAMPCRPLG
jgi:hypothetical protein